MAEPRFRKVQTEADDRFFDAAAVMFPSRSASGAIAPSLQMGDAEQPVSIYYWNATRGAMLMQAQGRGTTRRTGQTFPTNNTYQNGQWNVIFELPDLPAGIDWQQNDLYRFFAFVFAPPTRECFRLLSQPALPEALRDLWWNLKCQGKYPGFEWFASYEQYESTYIALFDVGIPEPPVPLFESAHDKTHPAQDIALENTYFYEVLGLSRTLAAPCPITSSPNWNSSQPCAIPASKHPKKAPLFRSRELRLNFYNATH